MEVRRVLDAGNQMQRRVRAQLGAGRLPQPSDLLELTLGMLGDSAEMASALVAGRQAETNLREFQNKLHGLEWFGYVTSRANLPADAPLEDWLQRVECLNYDDRPWAAEGAGYQSARLAWLADNLGDRLRGDLPQWSLIVLHTGLGMLLGERIMENVVKSGDLVQALARFCQLSIAHSRPGYEGCAIEPIGLVARTLYPQRIPEIDRIFANAAPDLREYFWHGIGRATYFSPVNFMPVGLSGMRAISMVREQAPDEVTRSNAVAGAAWAFTLVNLRTPEVMSLLLREHGGELLADPAFANGVRSALTIWKELQPQDPALQRLLNILPPRLAPPEVREAALGAVFRYRPSQLAAAAAL
jgi:hypothetical protein